MFERFTDRSRRVLVLAQEEARLLDHGFIGTEHLLLGLISESDGVAATALAELGVTHAGVRASVEEILSGVVSAASGSPPFTPRAKKVLELSLREALQLGHNYIGTEHLLLGLVREGEGVACQVLVAQGADLTRVRQDVLRLMSGTTDPLDPHPPLTGGPGEGRLVRREDGRRLRQAIEASLTDESSRLLRRYLAGELGQDEMGDGAVTRALAETVVKLQQNLLDLTRRFLPPAPGSAPRP